MSLPVASEFRQHLLFKGAAPALLPKKALVHWGLCLWSGAHTHNNFSHSFIHMKKKGSFLVVPLSLQWERLGVPLGCLVWSIGFLSENEVTPKHSRADPLCLTALLYLQQNPIYSLQWVEKGIRLRAASSVLTHSLTTCLGDRVQVFLGGSIRRAEIDVFSPVVPAGMFSWKDKIWLPILESKRVDPAAPDFSSSILFMQL